MPKIPAKFDPLHDVMAGHVGRGELPGLVLLISRGDAVHVDVIGNQAVNAAEPMRRDTLFRVSSMTKPITATAAMILVEQGKLTLDDPVDRLLPELANRRVLKRIDGPLDDTVPAQRPITLRDLLTFRMGFGIIWGPPNQYPIQKAAEALELGAFGPPRPQVPPPPDEWLRRFGSLPLMHQPGEQWMYNTGAEVLGVLIARAAGQPLETFFRAQIFDPLGMQDTSFSVPEAKLNRIATSYMADPQSGSLTLYDEVRGQWSKPPAFPSGGAGLVSTVDDFLAFSKMLLNQGQYRNRRIVSQATVTLMTSDQLTPAQKAASAVMPADYWSTHGWGFGMSVVTRRGDISTVAGKFGWDGGLGTSWACDPQHDMVAILMTQRAAFPQFSRVYLDFWENVYRGIVD